MEDLTEDDMKRIFQPMHDVTNEIRHICPLRGFNRGHEMHAAAKDVAPLWLQKWDDDKRWLIPFTDGWDHFKVFASAYGYPLDRLLSMLSSYRKVYGDGN